MHFTGRRKNRRPILVVLCLALATCPAPAETPGDADYATLQTLLQELRTLRQTNYTLANQWAVEQQQLQFIIAVDKEKLDALTVQRTALEQEAEALEDQLQTRRQELDARTAKLAAIDAWIQQQCSDAAAVPPGISADRDLQAGISEVASSGKKTAEKLAMLLNVLQNGAIEASRTGIADGEAEIGGETYSGSILRLGNAIEYFITPDDQRCAYRQAGGDGSWMLLDAAVHGSSIRTGIRVIAKEIAARLVSVPIPLDGMRTEPLQRKVGP